MDNFVLKLSAIFGILGVICSTTAVSQNSPGPLVNTINGAVQGSYMLSRDGKKIRSFRGIPYAQPPVGDLRFKVRVKVITLCHSDN